MKHLFLSSLCLALTAVAPVTAAEAAPGKQQALATFAAHQNSVILVTASIAMDMGGGPPIPPQEVEVTGTILTLDGQVAVSLSTIDPAAQVAGMAAGPPSDAPPPYKGPLAPAAKEERAAPPAVPGSDISKIRLFFPGGEPVTGKIILRDPLNDLLILQAPELPKQKITPVPLDFAAEPALLDELILISRLSPVVGRAHVLNMIRVDAILDKPALAWHAQLPYVGGPVFTPEGKFVGLSLNRVLQAGAEPVLMGDEMTPPIEPVIIPAAAIKRALQGKRETDQIVPLPSKARSGPPLAPPPAPAPRERGKKAAVSGLPGHTKKPGLMATPAFLIGS